MCDDFQVGDWAVCIAGDEPPPGFTSGAKNECPSIYTALAPMAGSTWRVCDIQIQYRLEEFRDLQYLRLEGQSAAYVYDARNFRKLEQNEAPAVQYAEALA